MTATTTAAVREAVSPMLSRLAAERATGVLTRERGALYLADGQVVHAESPATPGIDVLLTAGGALHRDGWWEAVNEAGARRRVGRFLVDSGRVPEGALQLCHLGALFDAAFFVLGPSSLPARFRYGVAHWIGPVRPVPLAAVERETVRRRELLHRIWPDPATDTAPLMRTGLRGPVSPRQRPVLDRVDGVRTAVDISVALGRPAFHTLVDLRRLAAAGMITAHHAASPVVSGPVPAPRAPVTGPSGAGPPPEPFPKSPPKSPPGPPPGPLPAPAPTPAPAPAPMPPFAPAAPPAAGATPATPATAAPVIQPGPPAAGAPGPWGTPDPAAAHPRPATGPHTEELRALFARGAHDDPDIALLRRLRDALEAL